MILSARVVGNHHRSTRMCQSIRCSKMLDSFASCRTTFLSLRSFLSASPCICCFLFLVDLPTFASAIVLRFFEGIIIASKISFVAQEICKRMFNLLSATNRKWLVWQEVACSGMSVNSYLRTTHAQQHRWLYNEVTLWNLTNEKRLDPN